MEYDANLWRTSNRRSHHLRQRSPFVSMQSCLPGHSSAIYALCLGGRMLHWIIRATPWSTIKNIGNSSVATALLLIPIFGYMILFSDFVSDLLHPNQVAVLPQDTPNPAQSPSLGSTIAILTESNIRVAYIGLWFLGVATIGYRVLCPRLIRQSASESAYVAEAISLANRAHFDILIGELQIRRWYDGAIEGIDRAREITHHSDLLSPSAEARGGGQLLREAWLQKNYDGLALAFSCAYRRADFQSLPVRLLIVALYVAGFVITMIPSVKTLLRVLGIVVD